MKEEMLSRLAAMRDARGPHGSWTFDEFINELRMDVPPTRGRHVAVVGAPRPSHFRDKSWQCFVGDSKDEVIVQALGAVKLWGTRDYEVWVGTLTERARAPISFELVPLVES